MRPPGQPSSTSTQVAGLGYYLLWHQQSIRWYCVMCKPWEKRILLRGHPQPGRHGSCVHPHIVRVDLRKGNRKCRHWSSQPMLLLGLGPIGGAVRNSRGQAAMLSSETYLRLVLDLTSVFPLLGVRTPPRGTTDTTQESASKMTRGTREQDLQFFFPNTHRRRRGVCSA